MDWKCKNHPNRFQTVKKAYHTYFGVKIGDQNKAHSLPKCSAKNVWRTYAIGGIGKGRVSHLLFQWCGGEGKDHITDSYFCMTN